MQHKIKNLNELTTLLEKEKREGHCIVQCHGVFDLLHPGHIRHLQEAKSKGDKLVVTLTPDKFVNKGPGRPAFTEKLRVETLAALACVDYVALNDSPDAVSVIKKIKPNIYAKGVEYQNHDSDVTGKISDEAKAVEEVGGRIHYTNDIVFSSSSLINKFLDPDAARLQAFLDQIKSQYSLDDLLRFIHELSNLKVLIVGDAIIDEYQYVNPMGQTAKGLHMVARCLDKEIFLGGSLIIAEHVASFSNHVTLLTAVGENCEYRNFIERHLSPQIKKEFVFLKDFPTLCKKRYVLKDGINLSKLFETYSGQDILQETSNEEKILNYLKNHGHEFDLILVSDFGNGFTTPAIIDALSSLKCHLALNTQTNSGNRGYNVVTHYKRANLISLNEPELRLAAHDRHSPLELLANKIADKLDCEKMCITRGVEGVFCVDKKNGIKFTIPALTSQVVDRIGAGDSFLSLSALCSAKGYPLLISAFIGSIAAAIDVQIIGNREAVKKVPLIKFLTRLMK